MKIIEDAIDQKAFQSLLREKDKIIIDVFAEWCVPCKELKAVLEEIEKENQSIAVISINLESNDWLSEKYEITAIPHLLFLKEGVIKNHFTGSAPKQLIEKYVANTFEDVPFFSTHSATSRKEIEDSIKQSGKVIILPIDRENKEKMDVFEQLTPYLMEIFSDHTEISFKIIDITGNSSISKDYAYFGPLIGLFYNNGQLIGTQGIYSPDLAMIGIMEQYENKRPIKQKAKITEKEFDAIKSNGSCVIEIAKQKGYVSQIVKPFYYRMAQDNTKIPFYSIEYEENKPWIELSLGIVDEEYQDFGEDGKKIPYYLFIKYGKVIKETGPVPPEEMESIIKGDVLNLYKVEAYPNGISEEDFEKLIQSHRFVIVDAYADWCGPCKMMKPIFADLSSIYDNIKFVSINSDCTPWLGDSKHYDFDGIPAFLFFNKGELAYKQIGGLSKEEFSDLIKEHLQ